MGSPTSEVSVHRSSLLLLILALACGGTTNGGRPSPSAQSTDLPLLRFQEQSPFAYASGYDTAETAVIRTSAEWQAAWARLHGGMTPLPVRPVVDFGRHVIVLVAAGEQSSGGHGVAITRAAVEDGGVRVHAVHTRPGPGCGVTMALTQPVDVVRLTTRSPGITFSVTTEAAPPCGGAR